MFETDIYCVVGSGGRYAFIFLWCVLYASSFIVCWFKKCWFITFSGLCCYCIYWPPDKIIWCLPFSLGLTPLPRMRPLFEVLKVIISFVLRIVVWALLPAFLLKFVLWFVPDVDYAGVLVIKAFVLCWL